MLRPQMLEAVFVAGSVFVGLTAPALKWEKLAAVSQREMSAGYELISAIKAGPGSESGVTTWQRPLKRL